jgi:hypothetical protein
MGHDKETRKITKLFRATKLKIEFRTKNTKQNILKLQPQTDKYNKSGIYQMKCEDCSMKYIEQTGRTFNTSYKEHIYNIKSNKSNTEHSKHILHTGHNGCYKNRQKRKIFEHTRELLHLQN